MLNLKWIVVGSVVVSVLGLGGCSDDKTIFVDKPLFEDPPEASVGFLGYDEEGIKLTICGNCHVGQQSGWEETAHASAWAGLQDSGHAADYCEDCHTAGPYGNATADLVGWAGTRDGRYHDVQCESCHGPGEVHVANPDASQPLASIAVSSTLDNGCGECHSGAHHPFAEEWELSAHATPVEYVIERDDPTSCLPCHTAQGALEAWGVRAEYIEKNDPVSQHQGITCSVCHDPHENFYQGQLRFPIDSTSGDLNLCMKCHHKRAAPEQEASTLRGPHSPEGPLLLGEAGWWPPGFEPGTEILGTHGTVGNQRMCASCHVATYSTSDSETGDFLFAVTGHRFLAIPCVDANGIPTLEQDCESVADRSFAGCAVAGCHGDVQAARSAFTTAKQRIDNLVADVDAMLVTVEELFPGELDARDGRFTTADGVWFNARLGELAGSSTHNPFMCEQLLVASKQVLRDEYGVGLVGDLDRRITLH